MLFTSFTTHTHARVRAHTHTHTIENTIKDKIGNEKLVHR